jgi:hypothetical protein
LALPSQNPTVDFGTLSASAISWVPFAACMHFLRLELLVFGFRILWAPYLWLVLTKRSSEAWRIREFEVSG